MRILAARLACCLVFALFAPASLQASVEDAAAESNEREPLVIHVFPDARGVPEITIRIVTRMLRDIGIEPTWIVTPPRRMPAAPVQGEVIVRVVAGEIRLKTSCGSAVLPPIGRGQLITLSAACIEATAIRFQMDAGVAFAYLLVHEIGHLLLGPEHAERGLMSAELDWPAAKLGALEFTPADRAAIRRSLEEHAAER